MTRSNCASAYAMRPSSENVFLSNGSPTLVMPASPSGSVPVGANSSVLSFAIAASTAAFRSGVSSRSPSGAANTRLRTPPCSSANSDSMRSVARCVSEPGIENSSFRLPPTVATSTIRAAMIPSQLTMTRHGCEAQARIQRARPPVESRSCARRRSAMCASTSGRAGGFPSGCWFSLIGGSPFVVVSVAVGST